MIDDKMRKNYLRYYKYILKSPSDMIVKRDEMINMNKKRERKIYKKKLIKFIKNK